jgi:hypothetical protein
MGYGPSAHNRLGHCWKNEHGSGTRMTPYFKSEKDADDFHNYFEKNYKNYEINPKIPKHLQMFFSEADLRTYSYTEIEKITKQFEKECNIKGIVYLPKDETLYEFFGCEMMTHVGYEVEPEEEEDEESEEYFEDEEHFEDEDKKS